MVRAGIDLSAGQWIAIVVVCVLGAALFFVLGLSCRSSAQLPDDLAEPTCPALPAEPERYSWMSERRAGRYAPRDDDQRWQPPKRGWRS